MNPVVHRFPWRRAAGIVNCLTGGAFLALGIFAAAAAIPSDFPNTAAALSAAFWTLFLCGIGTTLLWIGVGDVRERSRPSWIVRLALYVCVISILTPMAFVARDARRKQQAINNLRQLGEAVRKYDAIYKVRPAPSTSNDPASEPEVEVDSR